MLVQLNQNLSDIFKNNDFVEESDFTITDFHDEESFILEKISLYKNDSLFDLMKTKFLTNENKIINNNRGNYQSKIIEIKPKEYKLEGEISPKYYNLCEINNLFLNKLSANTKEELNKNMFTDQNFEIVESNLSEPKLIGRKRKKKVKLKLSKDNKNEIVKKKREDSSIKKHDKYHGDNIIKKIKLKLFESFLKFVNIVINENLDKSKLIKLNKFLRPLLKKVKTFESLLKIIEYKYIDRLNKKLDIEILQMKFKEIFSKDISPKYSKLKPESNREIIKYLINEEKDNIKIQFVLNMKFIDYLDVFTYKKAFNTLPDYEEEKVGTLINNFEFMDKLISDIYRENPDDNYLLYFIIYLYNYERYFHLKRERTRKTNTEQ